MVLWRISNYADLLGIGAMEASARWHTAGRPVVYLAENPSSALLEVFVHLEADEGDRPDTYHLLKIEANDGIAHESVDPSSMSSGWRNNEAETRSIGDDWLVRGETALLKVPSAITPETWNWVLNPRHAQAKNVVIVHGEKHPYDSRLFRG
ncbi:MAG: hypothetical protein QOJ42_975 [Acidobacteriaceae bacterium]|nr:hypothetical protein [Acidobacteriaceae bacterium]